MSKKVENQQTSQLIRENMKCPVCLEVLLPPIYQCETGHNICYSCVEAVHVCPLCKGDYGDTRNYFAEELVNSMTFSCKYDEYGCKTTCLGSKLKEHQESCECQPYNCPELGCKEVLGILQMGKHMEKHGFKVLKGESHIATIDIQDEHFDKKTEYNPWRISAFGKEFYSLSVRSRDGTWYFWAWILGLPREAKGFSYEMAVFSKEKQILFRGQPHSLRISPDELMKSGNCLVLNDPLIKAMRKENKINCSIRFIEGKNWEVKKTKPKKPQVKVEILKEPRKTSANIKGKSPIGPSPGPPPNTPINSPYYFSTKKSKPTNVVIKHKPLVGLNKGATTQVRVNPGVSYLRRKITDEENQFVMKMRESLRCPGCDMVISPPILQCIIGHNICMHCRAVREDCPLCRSPIGIARNFFAEELLYRTVQRCRYNKTGCEVCLPTAQIRLHELSCDFAPFECPFNSCRQIFDPKNLLSHLKSHKIPVVENELKTQIAVPKGSPMHSEPICAIPSIVMIGSAAFYPLVVREQGSLWSFWVCSSEYGNYKYEIILKRQSKVLSFQGPVLSLRMNQSQVLSNGLALITSDRAIKGLKTENQLDYSLKIAPIRHTTAVTFSTSLSIDFKKLKSSNVLKRTEIHANRKTSGSSPERRQHFEDMEEFELLGADFSASRASLGQAPESIANDDILEDKETPAAEFMGDINKECETHTEMITNPTDSSFNIINPISTNISCTQTSNMSKHTMETLLKEIKISLAKETPTVAPKLYDLMSGRNSHYHMPDVISSSPILPSVSQIKRNQNVRVNARKRKRCLEKIASATKSSVWKSTPYGSGPTNQSGSINDTAQIKPQTSIEKNLLHSQVHDPEQTMLANKQDEHIGVVNSISKAENKCSESGSNTSTKLEDSKSSNTSVKIERSRSGKSSVRKSKKLNPPAVNSKQNSVTESLSSLSLDKTHTPTRSSSSSIAIGKTAASFNISVEQKTSRLSGGQRKGSRKNSKHRSGSFSEGEQDRKCNEAKNISYNRSSAHVKFSELPLAQSLKNIPRTDNMYLLLTGSSSAFIMPKKSALKIQGNQHVKTTSLVPDNDANKDNADNLKIAPDVKDIEMINEAAPSTSSEDVKIKSYSINRLPSQAVLDQNNNSQVIQILKENSNGSSTIKKVPSKSVSENPDCSFGPDDVKSYVADELLINFDDTNWDTSPNRFVRAMFDTVSKSKSDLTNICGKRSSPALYDVIQEDLSKCIISECELLKYNTQSIVFDNYEKNSLEEEINIFPAGKDMNDTQTTSGKHSYSILDYFSGESDVDKEPVIMVQSEEIQTVEETQTASACQVGSSLLKLNSENSYANIDESSNNEEALDSVDSTLDLGLSYDSFAEGFNSTVNAVKSIFSGLVNIAQADGYDNGDGIIHEEDAEDSNSDTNVDGNIMVTNEDYGGYDDNEPI